MSYIYTSKNYTMQILLNKAGLLSAHEKNLSYYHVIDDCTINS